MVEIDDFLAIEEFEESLRKSYILFYELQTEQQQVEHFSSLDSPLTPDRRQPPATPVRNQLSNFKASHGYKQNLSEKQESHGSMSLNTLLSVNTEEIPGSPRSKAKLNSPKGRFLQTVEETETREKEQNESVEFYQGSVSDVVFV